VKRSWRINEGGCKKNSWICARESILRISASFLLSLKSLILAFQLFFLFFFLFSFFLLLLLYLSYKNMLITRSLYKIAIFHNTYICRWQLFDTFYELMEWNFQKSAFYYFIFYNGRNLDVYLRNLIYLLFEPIVEIKLTGFMYIG